MQCQHYSKGHCRNGKYCLYKHDSSEAEWNPNNKPVKKPVILQKTLVSIPKRENIELKVKEQFEEREMLNLDGAIDETYTYSSVKGLCPEDKSNIKWTSFVEKQKKTKNIVDNIFQLQEEPIKKAKEELEIIENNMEKIVSFIDEEPEIEKTKGIECCICLEIVKDKEDPRFGLLKNCDHVFVFLVLETGEDKESQINNMKLN